MKEGKSVKFNLQQQQQQQHNGHASRSNSPNCLIPKLLGTRRTHSSRHSVSNSIFPVFLSVDTLQDQLGDVLHWIRQVVAIVCGFLWGAVPLVGAKWIVLFLVLSTAIVYSYYAVILKIDGEDFGGHGTLLQEGLFASLTLFLLVWILVYSLEHF